MELFAIAWRNVFRNKRRSILNILAITLGITVMILALGWLRGFVGTIYSSMIDLDTGHVQILNAGYQEEKRRMPLDRNVPDWNALKDRLAALPEVSAVGARIDFAAQFSNGVKAVMVMARGVDPDGEAEITVLDTSLKEGSYFRRPDGVLIGEGLAKRLNLKLGDHVFINSLDKYGSRNLVDGTVEGIFALGYSFMDDNLIFTSLAKAQELLSLGQDVTRVVLRLKDGEEPLAAAGKIAALFSDRRDLKVYEWKEFAQAMVSTIDSRLRIFGVLIVVLFVLIMVGILNSMSMAVQERFREIGTMRAIGLNRRQLIRLFLAEGFWIGLIGSTIAVVITAVLAFWFQGHGIDIRSLMPKELPIPFSSEMRPRFAFTDFLVAIGAGAVMAVIGSWQPARTAGRMSVREALGSHL